MNITSAKYTLDSDGNNENITVVIDGVTMSVPLNSDNRHYQEIQEWVDAGNTISEP